MRVALPVCRGRVSPVFDVARRLWVVDIEEAEVVRRFEVELADRGQGRQLAELGVDTLVCGAISSELRGAVAATGVEVVAEIRGEPDEVLLGYMAGGLDRPIFAMPGTCHRRP